MTPEILNGLKDLLEEYAETCITLGVGKAAERIPNAPSAINAGVRSVERRKADLEIQVEAFISEAIEVEREACVLVAQSFNDSSGYRIPERIAEAIRERG